MENRFLKGKLYASNDPGAIPDALASGYTVIALVDVGSSMDYPNCVIMSSLLPPPDAISDILNGNKPMGIQRYINYLMDPAREESVVCLLAALYQKPTNFLLYTEYDADNEFNILASLANFLANAFGVVVGKYKDPNNLAGSIATPGFDFTIADLLYVNHFISIQEYAMMTPLDAIPTARACSEILRHINYGFNSMEDCVRACLGMINDVRSEVATGKTSPVLMATPVLSKDALVELQQRKSQYAAMGKPQG